MFKQNLTAALNKQRPNKNGYPLRIRAIVKRVVSYYPVGISLREDQWNGNEITNHRNKTQLNLLLNQKLAEIESQFIEASLRGEQPLKFSRKKSHTDFIEYCREKIKEQSLKDKPVTTKHKKSYLVKMANFKPSIPFRSLNVRLLKDYENYCREIGNQGNTVWSAMKFVKSMLVCAADDKLIGRDILKEYKMPKYKDPPRPHLTLQEVDMIEQFIEGCTIDRVKNVANWFLFAVYTAFRYEDVRLFNKIRISNGKILLRTEKGGADVTLKIHPRLQKVIDRMEEGVYSNQKCNDYLKLVAAGAGINKHLTFHIGRHSFAVIFLEMGGDIMDLSKLMGHVKISTTQIYSKISNRRLDAAMDMVWNKKAP
jgi:integrase/recombinase XerD